MPKTKKPRDVEKYRLLPPLDLETYAGLRANIAINGVQVPVVKDENGYILDGFARAKIAKELDYECPSVTVRGLTEQEKRSQVRALNLARRHMDHHTRTLIIGDELTENPGRSNRWIAKSLGVDDKTVARVRASMQSTAALPQLGFTLGSDGKYRPATKSSPPTNGHVGSALVRPDGEESDYSAYKDEPHENDEDEEPYDRRTYYNFRLGKLRPRACDQETPAGLARFLFDTISPVYEVRTILDPCAGRRALTKPWRRRKILDFEIGEGKDFFLCPSRIECDLVLCNPPFSQEAEAVSGYQPEQFLRRIVEVVPRRTPIVLITPMGMRLHQEKRSKRWRWLRDEAPRITSIISLPRDVFAYVDYHCEVLLFNMPKLKPHYFLPDRYL